MPLMAVPRFREEVLNVVLAKLLNERGIVSTPERIIRSALQGRHMPDVLVIFQGLRTIIEGKVDDHPDAARQVLADASRRVEDGIAHLAIAVLYPASLAHAISAKDLENQLAKAPLQVAICTEAGQKGFTRCDLDYLDDLLRRSFDQLIAEDVVEQARQLLESGVERIAQALTSAPATVERWAQVLGVGEPPSADEEG